MEKYFQKNSYAPFAKLSAGLGIPALYQRKITVFGWNFTRCAH